MYSKLYFISSDVPYILRRAFLSVLENHVIAQFKGVDEPVGGYLRQCLGELRFENTIDVVLNEVLPDRLAEQLRVVT
jgi:hypothetical protein